MARGVAWVRVVLMAGIAGVAAGCWGKPDSARERELKAMHRIARRAEHGSMDGLARASVRAVQFKVPSARGIPMVATLSQRRLSPGRERRGSASVDLALELAGRSQPVHRGKAFSRATVEFSFDSNRQDIPFTVLLD